ncbi:MAG: outer membrane protein assembly factor BamD [Geobacteraceae bacterium]|nr:outer membrane protein assembly factor BamD [Geobacteraceae bacterium]
MLQRIALALTILVLATSCANNKLKLPPETLFKQGENLYAKKKYEAAAEKWRKAKDSTTSPLLRTAVELKLADALYHDENYIEAAAEYENFRKLHPKNPKAPYALYMQGLSNFYQVKKIDVDQTPTKNAVTLFDMFLQQYPDSDMTQKVRETLAEAKTRQAAHEMYVGRFYYRTDKYVAAIGRFEYALQKYPESPRSDEALFFLGKAYLDNGNVGKAKESLSRLVTEYPKSEFVNTAKKILSRNS